LARAGDDQVAPPSVDIENAMSPKVESLKRPSVHTA
jgi:hypothetical protein